MQWLVVGGVKGEPGHGWGAFSFGEMGQPLAHQAAFAAARRGTEQDQPPLAPAVEEG
ncbi:hypothetical protein KTAU_28840 [Thermogemmatispora aurantia]|nr:hypothetical protein KTAU_28840 [Thermogemmatispora aurantia]